MQSEYLTEIYERPAKNKEHAYTMVDCEQAQKDRMLGKLYDQVDDYYRNLIKRGDAQLDFAYVEENGEEYALAYIYDTKTGEQIL
jgi:hypothetical protein